MRRSLLAGSRFTESSSHVLEAEPDEKAFLDGARA